MSKQIFCQFFSHSLGKGCYQYAFTPMTTRKNLIKQIVNLVLAGAYFYFGVKKTRRTDYLFYYNAFSLVQLVIGRGRTYIYNLIDFLLEFFKF